MRFEALQEIRRSLLARRAALLQRWRQELSDDNEWLDAGERDGPDAIDAAIAAAGVRAIVDAQERGALARIQTSLSRIERGTYDECAACHGTISDDRLRAVPDTDRCGACAPGLN